LNAVEPTSNYTTPDYIYAQEIKKQLLIEHSGSTTLSIYQINLWKHLMIHPAPQQHGCINHSGLPTFIPDLPLLTLDFFLSAATDDATEPPYMYLRLNKVCGCYAALTLLNRTPISEWREEAW